MWKLVVGVCFLFAWFMCGEIINMMSCFPLSFDAKRECGKPCLAIGSAFVILHFEIGFIGKLVVGIAFLTWWFLYGEYKSFVCHKSLSFLEKRGEGLPMLIIGGTALTLCTLCIFCNIK